MKRLLGITVLLLAVMAMTMGASAEAGYLKIVGDSKEYQSSADIALITSSTASILKDGDTIEVYGAVDLPLIGYNGSLALDQQYTWVLNTPNVTIIGKTADATIYCSTPFFNGIGDGQQTILVMASGVTISDLTVMPNCYMRKDGNGDPIPTDTYTNKTIEVRASDFTITNVTMTPNTKVVGATASATSGGSLYFNGTDLAGGLKNILVQSNTFEGVYLTFDSATPTENIQILDNTFAADQNNANFYFLGNTSWANPEVTEMGDVLVQGNEFGNMPAGFAAIVKQRMTGTFILVDNTTDDGLPVYDRVVFAASPNSGTDNVSGGKGVILVTEGGKTYQITVDDVTDPDSIVVEDITPETPPITSEDVKTPTPPVTENDDKTSGSHSSSGCNAGIGLSLLALLGLAVVRKGR